MLKSLIVVFFALGLCSAALQARELVKTGSKPLGKTKAATQPQVTSKQLEQHAALSEDHLAVAQRVVVGKVPCELGAHVSLSAHPISQGWFVLEHGRQRFHMAPVLTSTGAIRLEDAASGAVWLQLANKSMLMDQKQGRRLADACMNADQVAVADAMMRSPAPNLLEPLPTAPAAVALPAESQVDVVRTATN
jgi:hypothetical protein